MTKTALIVASTRRSALFCVWMRPETRYSRLPASGLTVTSAGLPIAKKVNPHECDYARDPVHPRLDPSRNQYMRNNGITRLEYLSRFNCKH
jgi:hypothetical protein